MKIFSIIFTILVSANVFAQSVADQTESLSEPISQAQAATNELFEAMSFVNLGFVIDGENITTYPKQKEFDEKKELYFSRVNEAGKNFRNKLKTLMAAASKVEDRLVAIRTQPQFCNGFEGNKPREYSSDRCKQTWGWQRGLTELRVEFSVTADRRLLENDRPFVESFDTDTYIRVSDRFVKANLLEAVNYFDGYVVQTFGDADRAAMQELFREISSRVRRFEQSAQRLLYMNLDTASPLKPQVSEAGESL